MLIDILKLGCGKGWRKYEGNPIIGGDLGECFDVSVVRVNQIYKMYFSWRSQKSIALTESKDGLEWTDPIVVMGPRMESGWEDDVNRISVVYHDDQYYMWYSGQVCGEIVNRPGELYVDEDKASSYIGLARSRDGIHWERMNEPVMVPTKNWEKCALMCPHVIWEDEQRQFRMWYSAGSWFEPEQIGYAVSKDGIVWEKYKENPILSPIYDNLWERERVAACQVAKYEDFYYMFYIGFEDIDKARICAARSKDGITDWEKCINNPIISGGRANGWDCEAAYKPFAFYESDHDRWILWYNGRKGYTEQIGVAFHEGFDIGF